MQNAELCAQEKVELEGIDEGLKQSIKRLMHCKDFQKEESIMKIPE